ncbi:MAG: YfhO family protein [Saprospiraceae bacterium]
MNFSKFIPHLVAVLLIVVVAGAYFSPQFSGKKIRQGDVVSYLGMSQETREYAKETGKTTLWTNSMFGGMPTYQINTISSGNQLKVVQKASTLFFDTPAGIFIAAMLSFYVMLIVLRVNPWISLLGAVAFGLSTNTLILFEAGHETKVKAIAYLPLIAAGILLAFRKEYIWGALVFALGMGIDLMVNHVQMTYYFGLTLLILGIALFVYHLRRGELVHFAKATAVLLLGLGLALGAISSNFLLTNEYAADTMRGAPILTPEAAAPTNGVQSSSETDGLSWDYAMNWSNGTIDLLATFIPAAAGGGSGEEISNDTPLGQAFRNLGARLPATFRAPTYHGALPFTSGPAYFGAAIWLLFVLGVVLVKSPIKWWLLGGTVLTFLLSMGSNAEWLNRFLFDYVPLFNKFRTPNSVLSVTAFLVPALGLLGLHQLMVDKAAGTDRTKELYIAGGIVGGSALLLAVLGSSLVAFSMPNDAASLGRLTGGEAPAALVTALADTRAGLFSGDAWRTFLIVALSGGAIWLFLKEKIGLLPLAGILLVITLVDLWGVGTRYLSKDDFVTERQYDQSVQTPSPADQQILQDPDPNYRVFNTTVDPWNDASTSYFHKSVGGYHAAKLQRYQDLIDRHLSRGNQRVFDMLNTKYIIARGPEGAPTVQRNPGALGNAWLVSDIRSVPDANAEIAALSEVEPKQTAVIHQEFQSAVAGLNPTGEGSISLSSYAPNALVYQFDSPAEQLAVFSEIWYGPDKGWEATIDGQPADIIRANYALRAIRVPAGKHEIRMTFQPVAYAIGTTLSLVCSLLIILGLIGYAVYDYRNRPDHAPLTAVPVEDMHQPANGPARTQPAAKQPRKPRKKK